MMKNYATINEYLATIPVPVREKLQQIRKVIKTAAGQTTEVIRYGIPTFQLDGKNLVHFAGYENHIGFYPTSTGIIVFRKELASYETAKGTVRFPLDKKIPLALIARIVKYRVQEENEWAAITAHQKSKGKKKKKRI